MTSGTERTIKPHVTPPRRITLLTAVPAKDGGLEVCLDSRGEVALLSPGEKLLFTIDCNMKIDAMVVAGQ